MNSNRIFEILLDKDEGRIFFNDENLNDIVKIDYYQIKIMKHLIKYYNNQKVNSENQSNTILENLLLNLPLNNFFYLDKSKLFIISSKCENNYSSKTISSFKVYDKILNELKRCNILEIYLNNEKELELYIPNKNINLEEIKNLLVKSSRN